MTDTKISDIMFAQITQDGFFVRKGQIIYEELQEFNCLVCHKPTKQPICDDCKLKHI